jgi:type I restriction enzyme S subunit
MSDLPNGWSRARLTDIVDLHDNRRVPLNKTERQQRQGAFPYYGANGLVDRINDYLFDGDYVLLAEDGGYFDDPVRGVAYEVSGKFWVNNHAHVLWPRAKISTRFLTYLLNSVEWLPHVSGSTRLKLTQGGMRQVQVSVPPLPEQERIVAKLNSLRGHSTRARQELDHIPKLIERYKQAVLAKALESEQTQPTPLVELIDEGPTNGYSPKASTTGDGTLSLKLTATTRGVLNLSERAVKRLGEIIPDDSRLWLEPGDLLIQRANSIEYLGAAAIFDGPRRTYIYPDLMMRIRIGCPHLRRLVWQYLNSQIARLYFQSHATGTAGNMPKINGDTVRNLIIPLPPPDGIKRINAILDQATNWLNKIATEYSRADNLLPKLDQAILAKAFRGELVPQDPTDEPAAEMLKRIQAELGSNGTL